MRRKSVIWFFIIDILGLEAFAAIVYFFFDKTFVAGAFSCAMIFSCVFLVSQGYLLIGIKTYYYNEYDPLAETAKERWTACILEETLFLLLFSSGLLFFLPREVVTAELLFFPGELLVFIYANSFSTFSPRRRKARWIFLAGAIALFALLILLFSKYESETAPSPAAGIAGFSVVGAVLIAWLVSIPISYDKHVKVLQYPGEDA